MRLRPRCLLLGLALSVIGWPSARAAEQVPDWENPADFARHTLPAHATLTPWPDESGALTFARERSPWRRLLNGTWRFRFLQGRFGAPSGFSDEKFHDLDEEYRDAQLTLTVDVVNRGVEPSGPLSLRARLWNSAGELIVSETRPVSEGVKPGELQTGVLDASVAQPLKWSAETPHLHPLTVALLDIGMVRRSRW